MSLAVRLGRRNKISPLFAEVESVSSVLKWIIHQKVNKVNEPPFSQKNLLSASFSNQFYVFFIYQKCKMIYIQFCIRVFLTEVTVRYRGANIHKRRGWTKKKDKKSKK